MHFGECCYNCLYRVELASSDNPGYLESARRILDSRGENDSAPYLAYLLARNYEKYFGGSGRFREIKKQFNDLMLAEEEELTKRIECSADPLRASLFMARAGNYVDFASVKNLSGEELLNLLSNYSVSDADEEGYRLFLEDCSRAARFLLIADNCGEIVLDKLMLLQLKKRFPGMEISVLVRGGEVLNDVTAEDAVYTGLDKTAKIVSSGMAIAGTEYGMLSPEAKECVDSADVILAKGQGNFESLGESSLSVYYSFLCKCDVFINYFGVPRLTGMFFKQSGSK